MMAGKRGIMVFVRDRTDYLERLLELLSHTQIPLYIIDDSVLSRNTAIIRGLASRVSATHVDQDLYAKLVGEWCSNEVEKYTFLIRPNGTPGWNLGYARNLALFLAAHLQLEEVAFFDDDIIPTSGEHVLRLFTCLESSAFVGARISGLEDDSIIGHIAQITAGAGLPEMISGGCMFFRMDAISHHFLNMYNEDWLWILLHTPSKSFIRRGEVHHYGSDPFREAFTKVSFQELGEVCLEGVQQHAVALPGLLTSTDYWRVIIERRKSFLLGLRQMERVSQSVRNRQLVDLALHSLHILECDEIAFLFERYFENVYLFQSLFQGIRSGSCR